MKIKILWHCKQQISDEIFRDFNLTFNDIFNLPTFTCAFLEDTTIEEIRIYKSLQCTRQLRKIKDGKYLYFFNHSELKDFLTQIRKKQLSARYNPLNELRVKTEALNYKYCESAGLYGLDLSEPRIMAVLNVTPDSFSDGGSYFAPEDAYQHALQLINEGADILDIGGESSRPGAIPVPDEEEIARVIPVIERIRKNSDILISIDTYKANVARQALEAGANWINDISGLRYDPEMVTVAQEWRCPVVVMHMLGTPRTMQESPGYDNVITELLDYFAERINYLKDANLVKIIVDPGIGFGKRLEDNINILKHLQLFKQFGYPVLVGTSRKSFIGQITEREIAGREAGTLASIAVSVQNGAAIVRTHKVGSVQDIIRIIKHLS
jgi:dihydropteroate synthase